MIAHVSPQELTSWLQGHGGTPVVLDVREPWELQTASVAADGFQLRTIPMSELGQRLAELDPGQPVACLCHHGARSLRVASFLDQNGFAAVANITGGIDAWAQVDPAVARY